MIEEGVIEELGEVERVEFEDWKGYYKDGVWGVFGEEESLGELWGVLVEE